MYLKPKRKSLHETNWEVGKIKYHEHGLKSCQRPPVYDRGVIIIIIIIII